MLGYILRRIALSIPTLIGVAVLTFFMLRVLPGDVVEIKLRADGGDVSESAIIAERARLGLDQPLATQFVDWMSGLLTFDLGTSMWTGQSVASEIAIRLPLSLEVALLSSLIAVLIAFPLGTLAAVFRGTPIDYFVRIITIGGLAVPPFWLGMMIIVGLITVFNWLPPLGYVSLWEDPVANLSLLIWPALSVGYRYSSVVARMLRSTILEVLEEDYIRTARAKGVAERMVVAKHAMRNALLPAITVLGLEFAFLIGGLVVTEQVFSLNGIGLLFVESVLHNDFTMIQGLVMTVATGFVLINLIIDILYAALDPRIRYD
ncbi:MAG: ABC transporter permease [Granulosicoccus sp.]|nr:ABC transporter permease [Granulosicoccus sp.]